MNNPWQCCFCGQGIDGEPAELTVPLPDGGVQQFRSHSGCVAELLHPEVPTPVERRSEHGSISVRDAYAAMYNFLKEVWDRTHSDDLGALLGGMSTLPDGGPADAAVQEDWVHAVRRVQGGDNDTRLRLG